MEVLPVKEKYHEFLFEIEKLKLHIKELEDEGKSIYESLSTAKNPIEYRSLFYRSLKKFNSFIERIVELNCSIEIQPFNEQFKDNAQLFLDIPHLPTFAEQTYEMTYIDGDGPWNFWLAHKVSEDFQALQTSLWERSSAGLLEPLSVSPVRGDYVCYTDNYKICRGVVTDMIKKLRFKIVDIDTSAIKILPFDKLFKVDDEVATVHAQAMNCYLVEDVDWSHLWTGELPRIFSSALKYNKLTVQVIKKSDGIPPSFKVKIQAVDCSVVDLNNCDDCDVASIEEWVCDRILPELERNNASRSSGNVVRNKLSIKALDAFYKESSDNNDDDDDDDEEEDDVLRDGDCDYKDFNLNKFNDNFTDDQTFKKEIPENCVNNFNGKSNSTSKESLVNDSDSKLSEASNSENINFIKEENENSSFEKVEKSVSPVSSKQKRSTNCVADYLLKTVIKSEKNEDDSKESDSVSVDSTISVKSEIEKRTSDTDNSSKDVSNSDNGSVPFFFGDSESVLVSNSPPAVTSSNQIKEETSESPSNVPVPVSVTQPVPTAPNTIRPVQTPNRQIYSGEHNLQPRHGMPNPHLPYVSGAPLMMSHSNYLWHNVGNHSHIDRYYSHGPVMFKPNVVPMQRDMNSAPNGPFWNRPAVVPPQANYNTNNYIPWSAGNKNVSYVSQTPQTTKIENDNLTTNAEGLSNHSKMMKPTLPAPSYSGFKVELKQQISLIDPEEEISAVISCVVSPDEIYVHLATENNTNIDSLQEAIGNYYSHAQHVHVNNKKNGEINYGRYCACYCKIEDVYGDDNFRWYRAEVLNWEDEDEDILVYLVDYGNKVTVRLSQLQPLAPEFGKHYMMAQRCHLSDVKCPDGGWPDNVLKYLNDLLSVNENYSVTVVPAVNSIKNSLEILLYKSSDKSSSVNSRIRESLHFCGEKTKENFNGGLKNGVQYSKNAVGNNDRASSVNNEEDDWDPMSEDYQSERNNYKHDVDDPCVAVSGYKPKDEERVCKFFAKDGKCWKRNCRMEHIQNTDGVFTMDREEVFQCAFNKLTLPPKGMNIVIKITNVVSANLFFAQIQDKYLSGSQTGYDDDESPETLSSLMVHLNKSSNVKEFEDAELPLIEGQLVLALGEVSLEENVIKHYWFRARINEVNDDGTCSVFYVDFGTTDSVYLRNIRAMHPKYLHLPFQAVECSLANVRLKETEFHNEEPINVLKELIEHIMLNGSVYETYQELQRLELLLQDEEGHDIGEKLVQSGYYMSSEIDYHNDNDSFVAEIPG